MLSNYFSFRRVNRRVGGCILHQHQSLEKKNRQFIARMQKKWVNESKVCVINFLRRSKLSRDGKMETRCIHYLFFSQFPSLLLCSDIFFHVPNGYEFCRKNVEPFTRTSSEKFWRFLGFIFAIEFLPTLKIFSNVSIHSEKADLKPRHDNSHIGVPHLDAIYTTPTGFHHPHHPHANGIHHGSPEAMKVRMAAMVLSPPTRV